MRALLGLLLPSQPRLARPLLLSAAPSPAELGHVFVVHGDVRSLSSDALLVPTRNLNNRKWFPDGPPAGTEQPPREAFTPSNRVLRACGGDAERGRATWLGHLDGRFAPPDRCEVAGGRPELPWFLEAASQFLSAAHADLRRRRVPPRNGRAYHVLAMPVVGTGAGGARGSSGEMIYGLLKLLDEFTRKHPVDVALVVKNDRMYSAAQAHRRQLVGSSSWEEVLGNRLFREAASLASLASRKRLCLFLGAGVSVGAGLPEWQTLISSLAEREEVPLDEAELSQLRTLGLPDQAAVLSKRLASKPAAPRGGEARGQERRAERRAERRGESASEHEGDDRLAQLVVNQLGSKQYSVTHGLLASLPVSAVVTTNYDSLFESAWRGAQVEFNVLPYETRPSDRFILKLHGDVARLEDIVLTRGQMMETREQRKALAGIVQSLLITKHLLFVGFSLQDPNFSEVAGTVRRALRSNNGNGNGNGNGGGGASSSSGRRASEDDEVFGTLLCMRGRPFLSELWPDLNCLPMDTTDAEKVSEGLVRAECSRLLEIFLDKVACSTPPAPQPAPPARPAHTALTPRPAPPRDRSSRSTARRARSIC